MVERSGTAGRVDSAMFSTTAGGDCHKAVRLRIRASVTRASYGVSRCLLKSVLFMSSTLRNNYIASDDELPLLFASPI